MFCTAIMGGGSLVWPSLSSAITTHTAVSPAKCQRNDAKISRQLCVPCTEDSRARSFGGGAFARTRPSVLLTEARFPTMIYDLRTAPRPLGGYEILAHAHQLTVPAERARRESQRRYSGSI